MSRLREPMVQLWWPAARLVPCVLAALLLRPAPAGAAESCIETATRLCLQSHRFAVEVDWRTPDGATGAGQALRLTADTGVFWFFRVSNLELVVKVLDGTAFNEHFWVFSSGLTNVEYTLTVTDTATGNHRSWFNEQGDTTVVTDIAALPEDPAGPVRFHCRKDATCPEILVVGDPHARIGGAPSPFRGYGDPSLERDPKSGDLWMSYSWLDVLVTGAPPSPKIDLGVRTHLARSTDGGRTFRFVRAVNRTTRQKHPLSGVDGWALHEVSTLVREPDGGWQDLWLEYFEPVGPAERGDFLLSRSRAKRPEELGDSNERWARGWATSARFGALHDLSEIPELADCAVLTEPALFAHEGKVFLALHCIVIEGGERRREKERLVLLQETGGAPSYVGVLLDADDAVRLGADTLEQADLTVARDGAILLLVTPIRSGEDPQHQGCVALEVADLSAAEVRREQGAPLLRAVITADGNGLGPGLCTYERSSASGVMMVITDVDLASDPVDIEFSLRATGVHP